MQKTHDIIVGYMIPNENGIGYHISCEDCVPDFHFPEDRPIPIFHENIFPYKQTCCFCGKVLVAGRTDTWPCLFD